MLKGKLVTLRATEREDLKRLHELERNVELVLHAAASWEPMSFAHFEKQFERWLEKGNGWMVIEADGVVIGSIGLLNPNRHHQSSEFGVFIYDPDYVGKGYGSDAIQVFLDWTFRIQNYRRIWLTVASNNPRAIAAYKKCGFRYESALREHLYSDGQYVDLIHMGMLRSEWEAKDEG
ncbi:GNAT family N-acetyltransferase [Herpetosiphon giganteus]|uniref:GNAT family N-acetyltransferase n=1 Tax=Herpetosiphon giganteus TaxID=2029754 RepID=UPI0019578097|nr:RimJ/RimL family protein N-acetyltransferase [Herpetosiphon giganteus]